MSKDERLDEALRKMDFYELALLTYERSGNGNQGKANQKQGEPSLLRQ